MPSQVRPGDPHGVLATIHPPLLPGETVEARYLSPQKGQPPIRRFHPSHESLLIEVAHYRLTRHCYFGAATRQGSDGTACGVSRAGAAWADIDAKLWTEAADPKAAALNACDAVTPRPSIVIDSGGGYQPYWLLAQPLRLWDHGATARLEGLNRALARAVCGPTRRPDAVQDVARILRLPDTLNHKAEYAVPRLVTVVRLIPDLRYTLAQLHEMLATHHPWALHPVPVARAPRSLRVQPVAIPANDLRERAVAGRLRRTTLALLDSVGPAGYPSASEADAAIAAALIGAGLTGDESYTLLLASIRGQDAVQRKGERHAACYWQRTVAHAVDFVGPVAQGPGGLRVCQSPTGWPTRLRTIPAQEQLPWPR